MNTEYKTLSGAAFIRWLVAQRLVGEGTIEVTIMASRFGPVRINATGKSDDRLTQGGVLTETRGQDAHGRYHGVMDVGLQDDDDDDEDDDRTPKRPIEDEASQKEAALVALMRAGI